MLIKPTRSGIVLLTVLSVALFFFLVSLIPSASVPVAREYAKQLTTDAYESIKNAAGEYGKNWKDDSTSAQNPDVGAVLTPSKGSDGSSEDAPKKDDSSKDSPKEDDSTKDAPKKDDESKYAPKKGDSSKDAPKKDGKSSKDAPKKDTPLRTTVPVQGMKVESDESEEDENDRFKKDKDLLGWNQVFSQTTEDGAYWPVIYDEDGAMNPNFIPHPVKPDTWITVAQRFKHSNDNQFWFTELVCDATFTKGKLECTRAPTILPIAATRSKKCEAPITYFHFNVGPHDARVSWGPIAPYIIYGSNSKFNCFGLFAQDFRMLVDWNFTVPQEEYRYPVELQRPPPYGVVEKNWFFFWDSNNKTYIHHDVVPHRVFTRVNPDGQVGRDIGKTIRTSDEKCWNTFTPAYTEGIESIHQATNSLAITFCNRDDEECIKKGHNTFIMHIFQYKSFKMFHGVYEPYVMLFNQDDPFGIHAISKKPIWITGRKKAGEVENAPEDQTEMVYVTSINWKEKGRQYHGYLDDVILMGFGVEDKFAAGIDVRAGDLLRDMNYCASLG